jgi:hypothetical protein
MDMPGMSMPAQPKAAHRQATVNKKVAPKALPNKPKAARAAGATNQHAGHPASDAPTPAEPRETKPVQATGQHRSMSLPMTQPMAHGENGGMPMEQGRHGMAMTGALGSYPMLRESSGTAWQPDNSEHMGVMTTSGDWMLMAHGVLNLVTDHQSGPRGADKAFASGMLMGMARRPLGNGALQLKAMISPDPLMGASGYPLLLASGETANGRDRLIDRQHPHDFFMELSASVSQATGAKSSAFVYAGLPGEPAFGPPAFMHREAILDSPEAPISHHWLDSTHISFGVITAGLVLDRFKIEVSRFNGREPDQHRWNIETGALDSTAVRLSWNPTDTLALQTSWGRFVDPEQLEHGVNQKRLSASALYSREIAPGWKLAATLAWGRKIVENHKDDAYVAEASVKHHAWTVFARGEATENRELVAGLENGPAYGVGKVSVGAVRDFPVAEHLAVGAGGLFAINFVPSALAPLYGGSNPKGFMAFARIKLN